MKHLLLFSSSLFLLTSCKQKVETTSPTRESITESVYASGIVRSKDQYQVFATVNGILEKIYVEEGDSIGKGAPLFTILNETSKLARENAQLGADLADFNSNKGKLDELLLNIELTRSKMVNDSLLKARQQNLWSQNIGAKIDLEKAVLNYQNSKTTYESANLRYKDEKRRLEILSKQAQKSLSISRNTENDFTITSILKGRVYSILKEKGEMVNTQTPLAVIGDAKEFILELQVDEYDITSIHIGQKVKVTMDSYRGQVFDAVITKIYPIMNERSKTATVEATFVDPPASLYPNLTLEANIILQVKENVLTLPRKYILKDQFVIKASGDTIAIKIGLKDYAKAEILEGLSEKEVVLNPIK